MRDGAGGAVKDGIVERMIEEAEKAPTMVDATGGWTSVDGFGHAGLDGGLVGWLKDSRGFTRTFKDWADSGVFRYGFE